MADELAALLGEATALANKQGIDLDDDDEGNGEEKGGDTSAAGAASAVRTRMVVQILEKPVAPVDPIEQYKNVTIKKMIELCSKLFKKYPEPVNTQKSQEERKQKNLTQFTYVHGEITLESTGSLFLKLKLLDLLPERGRFVDLGAGVGKVVFAAALLHEFKEVVGLEYLRGLSDCGKKVLKKWDDEVGDLLEREDITKDQASTKFTFKHGNFLKNDTWHSARVVFANSACFDERQMEEISNQSERMQEGSVLITVTHRLRSELWEVVDEDRLAFSWGDADVIIHKRLPNPVAQRPTSRADMEAAAREEKQLREEQDAVAMEEVKQKIARDRAERDREFFEKQRLRAEANAVARRQEQEQEQLFAAEKDDY